MLPLLLSVLAAGILFGILGRLIYDRSKARNTLRQAQDESQRVLELAEREAENARKALLLEGQTELLRQRQGYESDMAKGKAELAAQAAEQNEARRELASLRRELEEDQKELDAKRNEIGHRLQQVSRKEGELDKLLLEERKMLEKTGHLTLEEARKQLLKTIDRDTRRECADMIKQLEDEAREGAARVQRHGVVLRAGVTGTRMTDNTIEGHPADAVLDESAKRLQAVGARD